MNNKRKEKNNIKKQDDVQDVEDEIKAR